MNLLEVSVNADGEAAEAISELFNRLGRGGAILEERPAADSAPESSWADDPPEPRAIVVKTYLLADEHIDANRRAIEEGLWHLRQLYPFPAAQFRELREDDWANAWKSFHPVQHVGARVVLKPTWREYQPQPGELVVELDPGMAFGTGQHPSTRFCLLALERHIRPGMSVLDVGTGSGILAIAAAKLGASAVFAFDDDPLAAQIARENVALNRLGERVRLAAGTLDALNLEPEAWDLILINILAPVIVALLPRARLLLRPGGQVILSGIIATQESDVLDALRAVGLTLVERQQEGDWVLLVGGR
ncbi:MAG: 50S ribosomal protein L11 methyltransferase [Chloroflexi bacterium]|nr:50S ribosomal protein L11 methyltransferase [Chloroflexota bacterium]